jgi:hypothetical protein
LDIGPEEDPNLFTVVAACVWNSQYGTLIKSGNEGESADSAILQLFSQAVSLIPQGKDMRYDTHSDWLVEQWNDMLTWKGRGYQGLDRDACMPKWSEIMRLIEEENRLVGMVKIDESSTATVTLEAAQLYGTEGLQRVQEDRVTMVDGYRQPEAPWA